MRQSKLAAMVAGVKASTRALCLLTVLMWAACTNQAADDGPANNAAATVAADSAGIKADPLETDTLLPPMKSQAERRQLLAYWEHALALEQNMLSTESLNHALSKLKDFAGADGIPIRGELKDADFGNLGMPAMLAYTLIHPESWAEVEDAAQTRAGQIQGISRKLPQASDGFEPSERQMSVLRKDTTALKKLVVDCLEKNHAASIPLLRIVSEFKIREAILPLAGIYQAQTTKDDLILTTLTLLMEKSMYWEWLKSEPFKSMLLDVSGTTALTPDNAAQIVAFATQFAGGVH